MTQQVALVGAQVGLGLAAAAPAAQAIAQVALPAGYGIMQLAQHRAPAAKAESRKPAWECTAAELRERVTFRDVQAVSKKNPLEYHCRMFVAPRPVDIGKVLGNDAAGNPLNTVICPAQYREAVEKELLSYVQAGHFDAVLLACAQELKVSKETQKVKVKRAPVDKDAATAALNELASTAGFPGTQVADTSNVTQLGAQLGVVNAAPAGLPFGNVPAQTQPAQVQGLPAGMVAPAGFPNFPA